MVQGKADRMRASEQRDGGKLLSVILQAAVRSERRVAGSCKVRHPHVLTGTILCLCFVFLLPRRPFFILNHPNQIPMTVRSRPSGWGLGFSL